MSAEIRIGAKKACRPLEMANGPPTVAWPKEHDLLAR